MAAQRPTSSSAGALYSRGGSRGSGGQFVDQESFVRILHRAPTQSNGSDSYPERRRAVEYSPSSGAHCGRG